MKACAVSSAEAIPRMEKTAQKAKMLARLMHRACTARKLGTSMAPAGAASATNNGKSTIETLLTTTAMTRAVMAMAAALAIRMVRGRMGSGARLVKSCESGRILSHLSTVTMPTTAMAMERNMYLSGAETTSRSVRRVLRIQFSRDEYLSSIMKHWNAPGAASRPNSGPTPRLKSGEEESPPRIRRSRKWRTRREKGRLAARSRKTAALRSRRLAE